MNFQDEFRKLIAPTAPSAEVIASVAGAICLEAQSGEKYKYYDMASLTKIIFTVPALMWAYEEAMYSLEDSIKDYLPWFNHDIRIKDLLTHTSGLIWWKPFYQSLNLANSRDAKWLAVGKEISATALEKKTTAVYSDPDFIILGHLLEEFFEKPLLEIWLSLQKKWNLPQTLHFNIENKPTYARELYAPTEDCHWRKKRLQGEVHDDNTWAFGGISSHAGLFGQARDMAEYGLRLREAYQKGSSLFSAKTVRMFLTRAIPPSVGDWSLGFTMPTANASSAGDFFSTNSVGHSGYTGNLFWYDLERDFQVTIISNAVYYGREEKQKFNQVRAGINNLVVQALQGMKKL